MCGKKVAKNIQLEFAVSEARQLAECVVMVNGSLQNAKTARRKLINMGPAVNSKDCCYVMSMTMLRLFFLLFSS